MASYFSILLCLVTFATGLIWLVDAKVLAPKRRQKLAAAQAGATAEFDEATQEKILAQGPVAEFSQSVFPVIAFVFVLRSFLYEPFQIPSGSMMPTLLVGDFILVQKFDYGIRNPVANNILIETNKPERGDVVVFKYPEDIRLDYIKRVVGLPGDRIIYRNKDLYILPACQDGSKCDQQFQEMKKTLVKRGEFTQGPYSLDRYVETLGGVKHDVLLNFRMPDMSPRYFKQSATARNDEWVVPEGHYFVMGDNRDNSTDSRFWGFVPEENLVGKAVVIWMSFEFDRNESDWLPSWVPSNVRFSRVGAIPGASEVAEHD